MSSSPRQAQSEPRDEAPRRVPAEGLPFPYCEVALPAHRHEFRRAALPGMGTAGGESDPRSLEARAFEARGAERETQAQALGRQQGEAEARGKFAGELARERSAVSQALADFARERAVYYQRVEQEAVQLALSIARKVLHREAQVDPLLLMGIARVALERIAGATGVTLAVHPQRVEDWRDYLASHMDPAAMPELVAEPAMAFEQCQLRTSMGSAQVGVEVQLKEIEQGLTDLLAARPERARP